MFAFCVRIFYKSNSFPNVWIITIIFSPNFFPKESIKINQAFIVDFISGILIGIDISTVEFGAKGGNEIGSKSMSPLIFFIYVGFGHISAL